MTTTHLMLASAADPLGVWPVLWDLLVLLTMAMLLGNLAARLGQSVIVGYLLAGTAVGPNALGWVSSHAEILNVAEVGVALLMFSIGLEFSAERLLALRTSALKIGPFQVLLTTALAYLGGLAMGVEGREALIIGMMVTMSSTACVLRLLTDRDEVETQHGRSALGILLFQDAAVVPMILLTSVMATGGAADEVLAKLLLALLAAALLLGAFYLLFNVVAPRLFLLPTYRRNRDLPILLAVVMATGSAWATHALGLSPALGAFAAGILLATSPFAVQIRADTRPLMTVMVTVFFAAIGLFGDPAWLVNHWSTVTAVVLTIIIGKPLVIAVLSRIFGQPWRSGIATALCLAQVGEFSFVLATIAQSDFAGPALISPLTFRTMISATIVTLLLTPYFVAAAPRVGNFFERGLAASQRALPWRNHAAEQPSQYDAMAATDQGMSAAGPIGADSILIIGFGPVGQYLAASLQASTQRKLIAIELSPKRLRAAKRHGVDGQLGDATQRDVLHHAGVNRAKVVVITLRDHGTTRDLIHLIRDISPETLIVARCRYHAHVLELLYAGAHKVVDEDTEVSEQLAAKVCEFVGAGNESSS
jgi:CPA2 family monovalent cation:H+ antiporter-2